MSADKSPYLSVFVSYCQTCQKEPPMRVDQTGCYSQVAGLSRFSQKFYHLTPVRQIEGSAPPSILFIEYL